MSRSIPIAISIASLLAAVACGGGDSSGSGSGSSNVVQNTQTLTVNSGPTGDYVNGAFTSVVVCVPGTTNCQTISGVLVDTGSSGFRVLSAAMSLSLPQQNASNGNPVFECFPFQDGFTWGPIQMADIKLAGEQASAVPIQVIGLASFSNVPAGCSSFGVPPENSLSTLGANAILGVGSFRQDCGDSCAQSGSSNPGLYYSCSGSTCQVAAQPLAQQAQNPVWLFQTDNNGLVVQLPTVPATGSAVISGSLIFGIGTQSDNALGSARVQTLDNKGSFTTVFQGASYGSSFIDTGSNGLFFLDSATTGMKICASSKDFYCPPSPQAFSATNRGVNGTTTAVNFTIDNAETLLSNQSLTAFPTLGGPNSGIFDWGLPFFYGRTVFIAIEGQSTPGGVGPYWAY